MLCWLERPSAAGGHNHLEPLYDENGDLFIPAGTFLGEYVGMVRTMTLALTTQRLLAVVAQIRTQESAINESTDPSLVSDPRAFSPSGVQPVSVIRFV